MPDPTSSAETCSPIGSADIRKNPRMNALTSRNTSPPRVTKTIRATAETSRSAMRNGLRLAILSDKAGITIEPRIPPAMKTPPTIPASVMLIPNGSNTFSNYVASAVNRPTPMKKASGIKTSLSFSFSRMKPFIPPTVVGMTDG